MQNSILSAYLPAVCTVLAVLILAALVRAIMGPRFTDRIVAVNLIGTITIITMCLLSVYFNQAFLLDVAIVYALLSFIAIVVLTRLVIVRRRVQMEKEQAEAAAASAKPESEEVPK